MRLHSFSLPVVAVALCMLAGCKNDTNHQTESNHDEHSDERPSTIVHLDKHKVYHAGIKVDSVKKKSVAIPLSLSGVVAYDERRRVHISARLSGRIETINVVVNDNVKSNEILLQMYSTDFLGLQSEFLVAAKHWDIRNGNNQTANDGAQLLYESAKNKLRIIEVTAEELTELEKSNIPANYYKVRAPITGTLIESKVMPGVSINEGDELFEIADVSRVWILIDIYEKNLPHIREGMNAEVGLDAYPEIFRGKISSIYKSVDGKTRTVKARIEVENTKYILKPGMFCTVKIQTQIGKETIKIPASALLGETEKHFVFVSINDTTFEKRDVLTGVETREFAEILDGLLEDEQVVVKGGFFLKSELAKETFGEEH